MIIYYLRTTEHLPQCNRFCESMEEVKQWIDEAYKIAVEFRAPLNQDQLKIMGWNPMISDDDMMTSVDVTIIDTDLSPKYRRLYSRERAITTANLERNRKAADDQIRRKEERMRDGAKKVPEEIA